MKPLLVVITAALSGCAAHQRDTGDSQPQPYVQYYTPAQFTPMVVPTGPQPRQTNCVSRALGAQVYTDCTTR